MWGRNCCGCWARECLARKIIIDQQTGHKMAPESIPLHSFEGVMRSAWASADEYAELSREPGSGGASCCTASSFPPLPCLVCHRGIMDGGDTNGKRQWCSPLPFALTRCVSVGNGLQVSVSVWASGPRITDPRCPELPHLQGHASRITNPIAPPLPTAYLPVHQCQPRRVQKRPK